MRSPGINQHQRNSGSHRAAVSVGELPERDFQLRAVPEMEELIEENNVSSEKICVAVGKDMSESVNALRWALQNLENIESASITLLHIQLPLRYIPSPMGRLPVNQVSKDMVNDYKRKEEKEINSCMKKYLEICSKAKVKAEKKVIEKAEISKGIVEVVAELGVGKLIMGTKSGSASAISKKMKGFGKADYVHKHAIESCEVSIVCKGKLVLVRDGSPVSNVFEKSRSYNSPLYDWMRKRRDTSGGMRSPSEFVRSTSSAAFSQRDPDASFLSSSFSPIAEGSTPAWMEGVNARGFEASSEIEAEQLSPESEDTDTTKIDDEDDMEAEACGNSASTRTTEGFEEANTDVAALDRKLREALQNAEKAKRDARYETEKRQKAEAAAFSAIQRFKECEARYKEAAREKEDAKSLLRNSKQQCEEITRQRDEAMEELEKMVETLRSLETEVNEASRQRHQAIQDLEAAQQKIGALEEQNNRTLQERNDAIKKLQEYLAARPRMEPPISSSSSPDLQFREYRFEDIVSATCNFANHLKIGEGGYGMVYKAELNSRTVAIKILKEGSLQGRREFQREIDTLRDIRHPHLVRIVGACFERACIVYEYTCNGCLADRLSCENGTPPLPWHARIRIAAEICSALQFLHSSKPDPIVHRDLKPANILLDEDYVSKISDFGLARPLPEDLQSETEPKGTFAYMDPEYLRTGQFTTASDVYGLGVVILQLLTGKSAFGLVKKVETSLESGSGKLKEILDPSAGDWPFEQAAQLAYLAVHCTEGNRKNRPDLQQTVMKILDELRASAIVASSPAAGHVEPGPKIEKDNEGPPSFFLCPIFQEVMYNPHVAADGFTYEMEAIKGWLDCGRDTSPMTNLKLDHINLIPNHSLRSAIRQWQEKAVI